MGDRRNIRLWLEYDGTRYHCWQRQKNALTIQEVVEAALLKLTQEKVSLIGSGRTDAGVHALGQVANFFTTRALPLKAFLHGLNSLLPPDIAILEVQEAPMDFHARKSARHKTYEYRLLNRPVRSPLSRTHGWWLDDKLHLEAMQQAAASLLGEHDFSAFRASGGRVGSPVRKVLAASWQQEPGGWLLFSITANGFLRGMVRSLMGTMVEIGQGKRPPTDLKELLQHGQRHLVGPTAPAHGLFLVEVVY